MANQEIGSFATNTNDNRCMKSDKNNDYSTSKQKPISTNTKVALSSFKVVKDNQKHQGLRDKIFDLNLLVICFVIYCAILDI